MDEVNALIKEAQENILSCEDIIRSLQPQKNALT